MTDILTPLVFAAGGISPKSSAPELSHFLIRAGRVVGFDGVLAMSAPIDIDLSIMPRAAEMIAAVKACKPGKPLALARTSGGKTGLPRLSLKSDSLKVFIPTLPDDYALLIPEPAGQVIPVTSKLMDAIQAAIPFCSDGQGPLWSQGVRFKGASVFSTNSIVLIESWHGGDFPQEFIIPVQAAKALAKLKEPITRMQVSESSATFWFGDKWMRTSFVYGNWPENVEPTFNLPGDFKRLPNDFYDSVKTLASLSADARKVYFSKGFIKTSTEDNDGASIECDVAAAGIFSLPMLLLMEGAASSVAWNCYPKPCPFQGPTPDAPTVRGIILGFTR